MPERDGSNERSAREDGAARSPDLNSLQSAIIRPHLQAFQEQQTAALRPYLEALQKQQTAALRPYLEALQKQQTAALRPYLEALQKQQTAALRPYLVALQEMQASLARSHVGPVLSNAMTSLASSTGDALSRSAFRSVSASVVEMGSGTLASLWEEREAANRPTVDDAAARVRRREPSLSPDAARALTLTWLWLMIFLILFTVVVENFDHAKEIEAISGVTPFGVANVLLPLAAAYWLAKKKD